MAEIAFFGTSGTDEIGVAVSVGFTSSTGRQGIILDCVGGDIRVADSQPSLHEYPKREQEYMKKVVLIVYVLTAGNDRKT
jgi:hypothetical protein